MLRRVLVAFTLEFLLIMRLLIDKSFFRDRQRVEDGMLSPQRGGAGWTGGRRFAQDLHGILHARGSGHYPG